MCLEEFDVQHLEFGLEGLGLRVWVGVQSLHFRIWGCVWNVGFRA